MAQSPAERRAKRDEYARSLTDPRSGQPFKNYNALDSYQRNVKAQTRGFENRASERRTKEADVIAQVQRQFPQSWQRFKGDQRETKRLAKDFLKAFGKYPRNVTHRYEDESEELREAYLNAMDERGYDWSWRIWRDEYAAL